MTEVQTERPLLERILAEVEQMSQADVEAAVGKIKQRRTKEKVKAKEKQGALTPEEKERQRQQQREYGQRPDVKEKAREYARRPEVKARVRAQDKARRDREKLIIAKARKMGLDKDL